MAISKHTKKAIVQEFLDWLPYSLHEGWSDGGGWNHDPDEVLAEWIATFAECDSAVAFGKGHQSVSYCVHTEPGHTTHIESTYDIEWTDEDCRDTYTRARDDKVFRLAFNDHGWY
jgi:hypothetical protein